MKRANDELTLENVLEFERSWWKYAGVKAIAIEDRFGCSIDEYYDRLGEILDDPCALEIDRILVVRLKRLRAYRARSHAARVLGATLGYRADTDGFRGSP